LKSRGQKGKISVPIRRPGGLDRGSDVIKRSKKKKEARPVHNIKKVRKPKKERDVLVKKEEATWQRWGRRAVGKPGAGK